MNKQVIVLGMHRSGTSTIALILQSLGINMGNNILGATSSNPYGHAEDRDFLDLHETMLKKMKGSWDFPPTNYRIDNVFHNYEKVIKKMIEEKNSAKIWGWKEPRTTLFVKNYNTLLSNPYYICVNRDKLEIAKSLKKRDHMPIKKGIKLSQRYDNELYDFLDTYNPDKVLNLSFDEFHSTPNEIVARIVNFLGIKPTQKQIDNALNIIKPLSDVRQSREHLYKSEFKAMFKKSIRNPLKACNYLLKDGWKIVKYHLGI